MKGSRWTVSIVTILLFSSLATMVTKGLAKAGNSKQPEISFAQGSRQRLQNFEELYQIREDLARRRISWSNDLGVRIGVMEAQDEIELSASASFVLEGGDEPIPFDAGQVITFRVKESRPSERLFWPVVKTVPQEKEGTLASVVEKWERLGHEVEVHAAGARLYYNDFLIHDNRRYFVSVEASPTETQCIASFQELIPEGVRPWPLETLEKEAKGSMELLDSDGSVIAEFSNAVKFSSSSFLKVFDVEYGVGYPWHGFQDRHFRGTLEVRVDKLGKLQLINELDIEDYLQGVVPSEMSAHYPHQALCSQSIAARGETLAKYGTRHLADPYHLCSSQHCQVYGGKTKEHERTNAAVQETLGLILRQGDSISDTVYSACCGGHTEHNHFVWSTDPCPALVGKVDLRPDAEPFPDTEDEEAMKAWFSRKAKAWCNLSADYYQRRFRWKTQLSKAKVDELVSKKYPKLGSVEAIIPLSRGVSGRLRALQLQGSNDTVIVQKELPIRLLFGGLNSGAFVVEESSSAWTFIGAGWGHGVGMCQWGARGMAEAGKTYREILSHYFSNTYILDVYRLKK